MRIGKVVRVVSSASRASVARMQRVFQIDAGEDGEDIGLHEGDDHFEPVHRGDREDRERGDQHADGGRHQDHRREASEDLDHGVAGHHVARKSDRVADRTHEIGDHLDHREDRAQRERRRADPEQAEEMGAVLHEADDGHGDEDQDRQHAGDGDMRGGRERERDQAEEVREDDEQEQGEDVGEELQPFLAGHIFDHLVDEAVDELGERLHPRRDDGAATGADDEQKRHADQPDRHPQRDVGRRVPMDRPVTEQGMDLERFHRMERQTFARFFRHVYFPSASEAGAAACAFLFISSAERIITRIPATRPRSVNTSISQGFVPASASSPNPMPKPIPSPETISITIRHAMSA
ncbi:hypothetical protein SDC9_19961 [bioreactor metagenome]|uniref:Uncharacterized protein n=1 Tax=bioreactor metagenome TaxID=1076179 RepID=A0A644U5F2_9ZZZZ